jgi:hypothetical protein
MSAIRPNGSRTLADLFRDLAEDGVTLFRDELKLARTELSAVAQAIGMGTGLVATGAVLALLGALSTVVGIALLIGDQWLPADRYWVAALMLLVITAGVAVVFAKRGMALVSPRQLAPDQTATTLKEDKEWLKQRLTSGGTSN